MTHRFSYRSRIAQDRPDPGLATARGVVVGVVCGGALWLLAAMLIASGIHWF